MSVSNEEIGIRLTLLRKSKHLEQKEMGEIIGVGQSAISRIESGNSKLTKVHIRKLIDKFHIDPDYFTSEYVHNSNMPIINEELSNYERQTPGGIPSAEPSINQILTNTNQLMTQDAFNTLVGIIKDQREDIRYALENQRLLIQKLPDATASLGEIKEHRAANS